MIWPFKRCDHDWKWRDIHGDERLHRGIVSEWYCTKCNRSTQKRPVWAAPKIAWSGKGGGVCINCGAPYSKDNPYGGIDEADGVHMCDGCWQAYELVGRAVRT